MPLTPAVTALLWALAIGFGLQYVGGDTLERWLMLWPLGEFTGRAADGSLVTVGFMPWQVVTYAFLHDGFGHLFFNALAVWMFGAPVEEAWGRKRFLTFWFVCVVGAGIGGLDTGQDAVQLRMGVDLLILHGRVAASDMDREQFQPALVHALGRLLVLGNDDDRCP